MQAGQLSTRVTLVVIACLATAAHAGTFDCLPSNLGGAGTKALVKSTTRGDFAAWYCPGKPLPNLAVCAKATCSLVGTKRAVAALVSNPSLQGLNEAMKPYSADVWRDPALVEVWAPYIDEIRALVP